MTGAAPGAARSGAGRGEGTAPAARYDRLDALRGLAIVWMASFHFSFDLAHVFHVTQQNFYRDALWLHQRTAILSLFLLCAGLGQAIATAQAQAWPRFWRRWAQIAGCAVLVSAGSAWMFPHSWISFGVLHGMAVMLTARAGAWLLPLGLVAVLLPRLVHDPFFDTRLTNWVGLVTHKPITEDWVPVLPWLGVMWWGLAAGGWLLARRPRWLAGPLPRALHPLALLGRWSLTVYMVHQPVFIGLLWIVLGAPR